MFPAIISPILRNTRSSALEDGQNYRPKHVELIEVINKVIIVASSWLIILLQKSILCPPPTLSHKGMILRTQLLNINESSDFLYTLRP